MAREFPCVQDSYPCAGDLVRQERQKEQDEMETEEEKGGRGGKGSFPSGSKYCNIWRDSYEFESRLRPSTFHFTS